MRMKTQPLQNKAQRAHGLFVGRKFVALISLFIILMGASACRSEYEKMIDKADRELLQQKSQLAKYLYLQVLEKRKERDDVRYRALKGLANVSATQLYEYREAAVAFSRIFEEFGQVGQYQVELRELRLMASKIWRLNLERPDKALDVLTPMIEKDLFEAEFGQELGRVYVALGDYKSASHWFSQTLEIAANQKNCELTKSLQLDLLQVFYIQDQCGKVFEIADMKYPKGCSPDKFAINVERANCLELTGDTAKAAEIYQEILKNDPKNLKALFFLEGLKRRQKQKQTK